jgi:hypothetical protein
MSVPKIGLVQHRTSQHCIKIGLVQHKTSQHRTSQHCQNEYDSEQYISFDI